MAIGHKIQGSGENKVIVIHDWSSDMTSYDPILPYLDTKTFTYAFIDLRGYGKSKDIEGVYTVDEAVSDTLELVGELGWRDFQVIGHSMSGMIAQKIALDAGHGCMGCICITPVPASGLQTPPDILTFLESGATDNDELACQMMQFMTGPNTSDAFIQAKVSHWRACSTVKARLAYLKMFTTTDFSKEVDGLNTPFLVIVGQEDAEGHSKEVMEQTFGKWYPHCKIEVLENTGHYPMQQAPEKLVHMLEDFLNENSLY